MAPRDRVALLAITALVLVPAVLAGVVIPSDGSAMSTSLAGSHEQAARLTAVPLNPPPPVVPRGLPEATVIVTVAAALRFSSRRRSLHGVPFRLGDVGDRWRALLFGAPPSFL